MINRDDLMERLLAAPGAILDHEQAFLRAQQELAAARDTLCDREAEFTVGVGPEGEPYLSGRNEAQRAAQLRDLTAFERAAVRHAEDQVAAARLQLVHRREDFAALRSVARLLAGGGASGA